MRRNVVGTNVPAVGPVLGAPVLLAIGLSRHEHTENVGSKALEVDSVSSTALSLGQNPVLVPSMNSNQNMGVGGFPAQWSSRFGSDGFSGHCKSIKPRCGHEWVNFP